MVKRKFSSANKIFVIAQLSLILGFFVFVYFFAPRSIYPLDEQVIDNNIVNFQFRNAHAILIDDNSDFSSPYLFNGSLEELSVRFKPGTYYWKSVGLIEGNSRKFTINSNVGLEIDSEEDVIRNVGDVELNVSEVSESGFTGLVILDVDFEYPVDINNKTEYRGESNE